MSKINLSHWTERAPMPLPRAHCAVGAWNGKLLVAGGTYWSGNEKIWSDRVDEFDPASNRWESLPSLPQPHAEGACFVLGQVLFIVGGSTNGSMSNAAWSFRDGAWHSEPDMTLPAPRRCTAVAVEGKTAYIIGGCEKSNDRKSATRTVWARQPGAKAWEERAPLLGVARFWPAIVTIGGKIFAAGGATMDRGRLENLDDIVAYDPAADRWSSVGRLPFACRGASGVAVDGKFLVIGGCSEEFERRIFSFDLKTGRVVPAGSLPQNLAFSSFVCFRRRIYGVSGENGITIRVPWTPIEAKL